MTASVGKVPEPRREAETGRFMMKIFVMCVSFANLSFLNIWADLPNSHLSFFRKYAVTGQELAAVTLEVLLLAVAVWIPIVLVARSGNRPRIRVLKWCALFSLVYPLNIIRISSEVPSIPSLATLHAVPVRILLVVLGVPAGLVLLWKWETLSQPVTSAALMLLGPMLPLVVASVAWAILTGPPGGRLPDRPPAGALAQKAGAPHVLWFVFDEWDEEMTFRRRPPSLELPELDRFRGQSFHADRAYAPARMTITSVPSLVAGKTFIHTAFSGASELLMTYRPDQPPERLTTESTVFSEARSSGFNAGIVGFYFPYCRMFDTTFCDWYAAIGLAPEEWERPVSFGRYMALVAKRQAASIPFVRRLGLGRWLGGNWQRPLQHADTYHHTHGAALASIVDPRLNLVFVHWNVPHPPPVYDGAKQEFSNSSDNTYLDNLKLLDRTVRDIRATLEKAGIWDGSTVLLTSDHPLRLDLWPRSELVPISEGSVRQGGTVPFLLKMAGEKHHLDYPRAIQTVVTKDLLLAVLNGRVTTAEEVAAWLDTHPPRQ